VRALAPFRSRSGRARRGGRRRQRRVRDDDGFPPPVTELDEPVPGSIRVPLHLYKRRVDLARLSALSPVAPARRYRSRASGPPPARTASQFRHAVASATSAVAGSPSSPSGKVSVSCRSTGFGETIQLAPVFERRRPVERARSRTRRSPAPRGCQRRRRAGVRGGDWYATPFRGGTRARGPARPARRAAPRSGVRSRTARRSRGGGTGVVERGRDRVDSVDVLSVAVARAAESDRGEPDRGSARPFSLSRPASLSVVVAGLRPTGAGGGSAVAPQSSTTTGPPPPGGRLDRVTDGDDVGAPAAAGPDGEPASIVAARRSTAPTYSYGSSGEVGGALTYSRPTRPNRT